MQRERLTRLVIIMMAAALVLGGQSLFAQLRIVGAISGTVQDPIGAVVPNAKVVLTDEKTGITKETTSSDVGTFFLPDLATGLYEVTVMAAGFQRSIISHISVSTSKTTDVRVILTVGQPEQTITVEGVAPVPAGVKNVAIQNAFDT